MERTIESIWKEGFSESDLRKAPHIDNFYNQKSKHLVDRLFTLFNVNLITIIVLAVVVWVVFFFLDAIWHGSLITVVLLGLAWYSKQQIKNISKINPGINSYEYLLSFDQLIKDAISKQMSIMRVFYPLIFLTTISFMWSTGDNQTVLSNKLNEKFADLIFVGDVPLIGLVIVGIFALMISYFADRIYQWDVRLIYGGIFKRLQETITELKEIRAEGRIEN